MLKIHIRLSDGSTASEASDKDTKQTLTEGNLKVLDPVLSSNNHPGNMTLHFCKDLSLFMLFWQPHVGFALIGCLVNDHMTIRCSLSSTWRIMVHFCTDFMFIWQPQTSQAINEYLIQAGIGLLMWCQYSLLQEPLGTVFRLILTQSQWIDVLLCQTGACQVVSASGPAAEDHLEP